MATPRSLLVLSLSVLLSVWLPVALAQSPVNISFPSSAPASARSNVLYDNFIGVSFELSPFNTLWGETNKTMPNAMQNYLSNLKARMTRPLRIRVGGNGMDASTYEPSMTTMLTLTDPDAYFNDVPVDFGPVFFEVLNGMADKVGEMQFMIGLSMLDPENDEDLIELATAARQMLGSRLDAYLLGNEPDLYAGHGTRANYTIQDYIPEIGKVLDDLRNTDADNLINETLIGGPSICCSWDLDDVIDAGLDEYPYKYYTLQHYPQNTCQGDTPQNTNISYYLSHTNVGPYVNWNEDGILMAQQNGVPVVLTEYNTVSCGGSNISSTFAASLWAVDAGLKSAANNFSAVYLHTREFNISYNLFDPPTPETSTESGWRTGSPYYAALMMAEVFSRNGSLIVDLNIDNSNYNAASTVAGYGIYDSNGTTFECSKLVLFNFADDGGDARQFTIPANVSYGVALRTLAAPSVTERTAISWANQTVGQNGDLEGTQATEYVHCKGGCNVSVPGPGAALVLLNPRNGLDIFYEGNSTIAGLSGYASNALSGREVSRTLILISGLLGVGLLGIL